jgi:hypothetical protein
MEIIIYDRQILKSELLDDKNKEECSGISGRADGKSYF